MVNLLSKKYLCKYINILEAKQLSNNDKLEELSERHDDAKPLGNYL